MTLASKQASSDLKALLDAVERGGKKDASDYTNGHLNESNLYKAPEIHGHKSWNGADRISAPQRKLKDPVLSMNRQQTGTDEMSTTVMNFALGDDGFLPTVKNRDIKRRSPLNDPNWGARFEDSVQDGALVEELDARKFMLGQSHSLKRSTDWSKEDGSNNQRYSSEDRLSPSKQKYVFHSFNGGATKSDQLKDLQSFERNIIRKKDTLERNMLSGQQSVQHLENKLDKELLALERAANGSTFHRLQIHGEVLDELTEASPIFSYVLRNIKSEYDAYLTWLLDNQPTQSHLLREQVDDLYQKRISNPKQLAQERKRTNDLETMGKTLLEENDRLREALRQAQTLNEDRSPEPLYQGPAQARHDHQRSDLADQLQDLHSTILDKLETLKTMRHQMSEQLVPASVCQNLEQCLKDTEIEVQKLLKQNEVMEHGIQEMEQSITKALNDCDTSDQDKQKCLAKLRKNQVAGISQPFSTFEEYLEYMKSLDESMPTNRYNTPPDAEISEEEDHLETRKWNWYIS